VCSTGFVLKKEKDYYFISLFVIFTFSAEDEHDVVWFWLEKDKPHECPVCSQYFVVIHFVENSSIVSFPFSLRPKTGHTDVVMS
jgi:hypothetical protein